MKQLTGTRKTTFSKHPLISVIIVTYNSEKDIKDCLISVLSSDYPHLQVIVVDNNSSDGTRDVLKEFNDRILIIENENNTGYAGGNNEGLTHSEGKYIAMINPDTEVKKGWLFPLVDELEKNEKIAAAQPKILLKKNKSLINSTGKTTHYLGFDWVKDYLRNEKEIEETREIDSFSGSCVLIRKSAINDVGFFDGSYFMYYEDGDLSWRLRIRGYKIVMNPKSIVYHDYKFFPSGNKNIKNKFFYLERNRLLNVFKNYELKTIILIFPMLILMEGGMLVYFLSKGMPETKILSLISTVKNIPRIINQRKQIAKNRRMKDNLICKNFTDKVTFIEFNNPLLSKIGNPVLSIYWKIISPLI